MMMAVVRLLLLLPLPKWWPMDLLYYYYYHYIFICALAEMPHCLMANIVYVHPSIYLSIHMYLYMSSCIGTTRFDILRAHRQGRTNKLCAWNSTKSSNMPVKWRPDDFELSELYFDQRKISFVQNIWAWSDRIRRWHRNQHSCPHIYEYKYVIYKHKHLPLD